MEIDDEEVPMALGHQTYVPHAHWQMQPDALVGASGPNAFGPCQPLLDGLMPCSCSVSQSVPSAFDMIGNSHVQRAPPPEPCHPALDWPMPLGASPPEIGSANPPVPNAIGPCQLLPDGSMPSSCSALQSVPHAFDMLGNALASNPNACEPCQPVLGWPMPSIYSAPQSVPSAFDVPNSANVHHVSPNAFGPCEQAFSQSVDEFMPASHSTQQSVPHAFDMVGNAHASLPNVFGPCHPASQPMPLGSRLPPAVPHAFDMLGNALASNPNACEPCQPVLGWPMPSIYSAPQSVPSAFDVPNSANVHHVSAPNAFGPCEQAFSQSVDGFMPASHSTQQSVPNAFDMVDNAHASIPNVFGPCHPASQSMPLGPSLPPAVPHAFDMVGNALASATNVCEPCQPVLGWPMPSIYSAPQSVPSAFDVPNSANVHHVSPNAFGPCEQAFSQSVDEFMPPSQSTTQQSGQCQMLVT